MMLRAYYQMGQRQQKSLLVTKIKAAAFFERRKFRRVIPLLEHRAL
jgi:hypothetical protein